MRKEKLQRHQSYVSQKWDENADNFKVSRYNRLAKLNRCVLKMTFEVVDSIWDELEQQLEK